MRKKENKKGISMIVVLWMITVLTVLVATTSLMTYSDISSSINLKKRYITVRAAETASDYVISYLPEYRELHDLDSLFTKDYTEEGGKVKVYTYPLYVSRDSSVIGAITFPKFIEYVPEDERSTVGGRIDTSLIKTSPTARKAMQNWTSEDSQRYMVNPVLNEDRTILAYRTRGVIEQGQKKENVAYRRVENKTSFCNPASTGTGHTIY